MQETLNKDTTAASTSIRKFLTLVLPQVSREIKRWNRKTDTIQDLELSRQAQSSLHWKRFHAQGGSFFAMYNTGYTTPLVTSIVAVQTISDYLDNLCDRGGVLNEAAFRYLHLALLDALEPQGSARKESYYKFYPFKNDGGYLASLVEESRCCLKNFPSYHQVKNEAIRQASLYNDLQVYKHLHPMVRQARLKRWFRSKGGILRSHLYWWEFAAACGSTLNIFALMALSTQKEIGDGEIQKLRDAYFPWVCGLHILLDYYIDQEEDLWGGDFNFASCYSSPGQAEERIKYFYQKAIQKVSNFPNPDFHRTIVKGLLAVYLSDPKAKKPLLQNSIKRILKAGGTEIIMLHRFCTWLRHTKIL